jgi:hypothetical protein
VGSRGKRRNKTLQHSARRWFDRIGFFTGRLHCIFVLLGCNRTAPSSLITRDDSRGDYTVDGYRLLIGSVG